MKSSLAFTTFLLCLHVPVFSLWAQTSPSDSNAQQRTSADDTPGTADDTPGTGDTADPDPETEESPPEAFECECPTCTCPDDAMRRDATTQARTRLTDAFNAALERTEQQQELETLLNRPYRVEGEPLDDRRKRVDVDSLPDKKITASDALLLVPRVVLYPVHLVTEYGVRWPLDKLFSAIEKNHVVEYAVSALTFADGKAGFVPLIQLGGSQAGSVGLNFFYNDLADGHLDLDIGAQGLPGRNLQAKTDLLARLPTERWTVKLQGGLDRRDDHFFFGVGPQPSQRDAARFRMWTYGGRTIFGAGADQDPGGASLSLGILRRDIRCTPDLPGDVCGSDATFSSDDLYSAQPADVAPLRRDHTVARSDVHLYFDTRPDRPGSGSGIRIEGFGGGAIGLGESNGLAALRYGAELSGFWDVFSAHQRTIGLRLRAEAVDPVSDSREIPVPETVTLGGVEHLRGFREGRFRGRSSVVATIDYRYPVWSFFDGELFVEVGELAGAGFQEFDLERLRGSAGLGLRSIDMLGRHLSYDFNIAIGTSPFSTGFAVDAVRVNLGTNWGF